MALDEPVVIDGTVPQIRQRLEDRLMVIGDLWFPTRAEMTRWSGSPSPLYLKWTRGGGFEIGPRLDTMPASRLAPALRGRLEAAETGRVHLRMRLGWPRLTAIVLWSFAVALLGWGIYVAVQLWTGQTHLGWLGAWAVSVLLVHGTAFAAWHYGRGRLMADLPWLQEVLSGPMVEGEDW